MREGFLAWRRGTVKRALPVRATFLLGLASIFSAGAAHSTRAPFTEYVVNDDRRGEEHRLDPAAAPLAGDGYLIGWSDNARGHTDIMVRRFAANGAPLGSPIRLNSDNTLRQHRGLVLSSPRGGAIAAAWVDQRLGTRNIFARILSSDDGHPLSSDLRVSDSEDSSTTEDVGIAIQTNGVSMISWTGRPADRSRISFQLLDAAGGRLGQNRVIAPESSSRDQAHSSVNPLPNGGWIAVWDEQGDRDHDIFFRLLDANGEPTTEIRRANADSPLGVEQLDPAVLVRSNDILIAWRDNREGTADLWGHWFSLDGTPESGSDLFLREASDPGEDLFPHLAALEDGTFALSWIGGIGNRQRAFARFFSADRSPLSASLVLAEPPLGTVVVNAVLAPVGNGWEHVWADDRSLTSQVFQQRHSRAGSAEGAETQVYTVKASASQVYPDVALFPDGGAVVTYGDLESGQLNIKARFLDAAGDTVGPSFQVNNDPVGRGFDTVDGIDESLNNFASSVAACSAGFIVTWAIDQEGGRLRLYGQLYNREGGRVGGNFSVLTNNAEGIPQYDARPAMRRDGSFFIAWRDNSNDDGGDVFYRNYNRDGLPLGGPVNAADEAGGVRTRPQQLPSVAVSPFDEGIVTWIDRRSGGWDVWAQLIGPNGEPLGANEAQHAPDGITIDQLNPSIALGEDRIVTVFEEQPQTTGYIRGRLKILETLARRGAEPASPTADVLEFDVNLSHHPIGLKYPQVALEPGGRFIVVWSDQQGGMTRVWAQRFDPNGSPIGDAYELTDAYDGSRLSPRVAVLGNVIQLVWIDTRREQGWDVIARRVDWAYGGGPVPVALTEWDARSAADGVDLSWGVPAERGATRFRVWRDGEDASSDTPSPRALLLTEVPLESEHNGTWRYLDRGAPAGEWINYYLEALDESGGSEFAGPLRARWEPVDLAWSAIPNPGRTRVVFQPPNAGPHRVTLVDLAGRRVRRLEGEGMTPLLWDTRDDDARPVPTGVYFARPESGKPLRILVLR